MTVWLHLGKNLCNLSVWADQKRGPFNAHHLLAIHILFLDNAKGIANGLITVGDQVIGQVILLFELLLGGWLISGDAEHHGPGFLYLLECVAEPARFYGSTGGISLGIEEQDQVL